MWYNKDLVSERYYRELLFLFCPWRNEVIDLDAFWPYEEKCRQFSTLINNQLQEFSLYRTQVDEALINMRDNENPYENECELGSSNGISRNADESIRRERGFGSHEENYDDSYDLALDLGIPSSLVVEEYVIS